MTQKKYPLIWLSVLSLFFLTALVIKNQFSQIDPTITFWLQGLFPRVLDLPFSILSLIGSIELTGLLWLGLVGYLFRKNLQAVLALGLFGVGVFIELLGKWYLYHPQPPRELSRNVLSGLLPEHEVGVNSFPSGHMFRTTFLAIFIGAFLVKRCPQKKQLILGMAVLFWGLMFVSRIYLGEHWLSDVVGGTLLGITLGTVAAMFV